ncbi:MAG: malate synthase G [Defluviimonas sp.]|nr:malate synthase G [Defluviimonas sp.]
MNGRIERYGLSVDSRLAAFVDAEVLAPLGQDADAFWRGFAEICRRFGPRNHELLAKRDTLQKQIDAWHIARQGQSHDAVAYREFLEEIGYLVAEPGDFRIGTKGVDREVCEIAGPQLVVPALNSRFLLNAANARWGSLYDAYYGTDALFDTPPPTGEYDRERGQRVISAARAFLDLAVPLEDDSWSEWDGQAVPRLCDPSQYAGHKPGSLLLCNNGLHIEIVLDSSHPIGAADPAGIADVVLESALTTIVDLEDSVAAVDAEDKLAGYRNWLGLMRGDLTASFEKDGARVTRVLEDDREWTGPDGGTVSLPGRSLLFVRNVGHLMPSPAILLADGSEIPEGIMDAVITSAIGAHDLAGLGKFRNSRCDAIYIVKPKMHGPEECALMNAVLDAVEELLGLDRHTIKLGLMDEERRTSINLAACIGTVKDRVAFINTGFLDRTGDEIHTSMRAGAMLRKEAMRQTPWMAAYERRNVGLGLRHGFSGVAQIGKGMWTAPERMRAMMQEKIAHPCSGASTAWVPSPIAATLHALHYHQVDVFEQQRKVIEDQPLPSLDALLTIPLADGEGWSADEVRDELENNAQGLLGYVVRWIDQGVGCSKVPDISDVALMEDRATLRISSQHIANWLLHAVCSKEQVMAALQRMAAKVDAQNAGDPNYRPMVGHEGSSMAFEAACALVFEGLEQPNGYTEPLLHAWRLKVKGASN